jgi:WD domain, G-beta repeat
MSLPAPHYQLARITSDGGCEEVEIYPFSEPPWETLLDRRGFLQAGLTAAAVLATLGGAAACATANPAADAESTSANESCSETLAHDSAVGALAVSADGATLASAGRSGDVKLWTLPSGALATVLIGGYREGRALRFTGDSRTLLALRRKSLQRWQLAEGEPQPMAEQAAATGASFLTLSADGSAVAILTPADNVEVRSLAGGKPRRVLERRRGEQTLVLSRDGSGLAIDSGAAILLADPQGERTLTGGGVAPRRLVLEPGGHWLAAGDAHGSVHVWSLTAADARKLSLRTRGQPVEALAFSPDGTVLAAGDRKGVLRLWSLPGGELLKKLTGKRGAISALVFGPEGRLLISGTQSGVIQLWDLPGGELRACLVDLKVSPSASEGNRYEVRTASGRTVSYTAPCGTPIPPGAICTCNCVPGSVAPPAPPSSNSGGRGSYTFCTCNQVCVCIPVG